MAFMQELNCINVFCQKPKGFRSAFWDLASWIRIWIQVTKNRQNIIYNTKTVAQQYVTLSIFLVLKNKFSEYFFLIFLS